MSGFPYSPCMSIRMVFLFFVVLAMNSCSTFHKPDGWPVEVEANQVMVNDTIDRVRFAGDKRETESTPKLTKPEQTLLTFLNDSDNIATSVGKVNHAGDHRWLAAEIYRVDPGKNISVLCENGYQQEAVFFHYRPEDKTWYRVENFEDPKAKGVPAVKVK